MSTTRSILFALACSISACDQDGQTGAPCEVDEDCNDGLVCDEHDGRGSCQEPHGHDDDGKGEDEGKDEDAGRTGDPCQSEADCEDGLVCDAHDGQGTCQEPHDHGDSDKDDDEDASSEEHESGSSGSDSSETDGS